MRPGIRRLQESELQCYADCQAAVASGDNADIKARQEMELNVFEPLRKGEKNNSEVEQLNFAGRL
jgi:hypothetical protein